MRKRAITTFVEEKLYKCKEVLNILVKFNLIHINSRLLDIVSNTDGYHRRSSSFTALMNKYRKLTDPNYSSITDLPSASCSTSLLSSIPFNVNEINPDDDWMVK